MDSYRRLSILIAVAALSSLLCGSANAQEHRLATDTQAQTPGSTPSSPAEDNKWHLAVSPYLWFAGFHGTVGDLNRNVSVHASPGDLLSHFNFGLMGAMEARRKRTVLTGDLLWIRLSDSDALPFPGLQATSADVRIGQFIWTSKVGARLVDGEKFKIDALGGVRFWHLGEKLNFSPSQLGLSFTPSQSWADPLVGGRIQAALSPKLEATIAGDVGGWGIGSQLDYQVVGLLGYKVSPKWTLQAGWRYLFVDYTSGRTIYNTATSGVLFGVTINLK
jgi:hypothetical protein